MRFFIDDMLGSTLIHVGVRLELEEEIEPIDQQQYLMIPSVIRTENHFERSSLVSNTHYAGASAHL